MKDIHSLYEEFCLKCHGKLILKNEYIFIYMYTVI